MDKAAKEGNPYAVRFPRAKVEKAPYDFSFSGLKSAVLNHINHARMMGEEICVPDLAASFQYAVVDVLVSHTVEAARELAEVLKTKEVVLKMKSGEGGRAFGSVSSKEIASAAKTQCGLEIDKKKIQLPEAIKALGVYEVNIKLHTKVTGQLKVKVVEDK